MMAYKAHSNLDFMILDYRFNGDLQKHNPDLSSQSQILVSIKTYIYTYNSLLNIYNFLVAHGVRSFVLTNSSSPRVAYLRMTCEAPNKIFFYPQDSNPRPYLRNNKPLITCADPRWYNSLLYIVGVEHYSQLDILELGFLSCLVVVTLLFNFFTHFSHAISSGCGWSGKKTHLHSSYTGDIEIVMRSYIQIDSISIDLADSIVGDTRSEGKCDHFTIRGYVSEVRKKDWKICWPFPVPESEKNHPSFPPIEVPNRCLYCRKSQQQVADESACKDYDRDGGQTDFIDGLSAGCKSDTNCSNADPKFGIQQDSMPGTLERGEIDLNTNLDCVNDCLPSTNEIEKQVVRHVPARMIDLEIGLEDNPNHPDLMQETHTTLVGLEVNVVSHVELTSNLKCTGKSSAEICNGGPSSDANKYQKELSGAYTIFGSGASVPEARHIPDKTAGYPLEPAACAHSAPRITENMVENDSQDHHLEKSTGLSRRRPRKVRLMSDLLSENGELKTDQTAIQGSSTHAISNASAASQAHLAVPGKVDIQGDLTLTNMGQSRKRKFLLDENQKPAGMTDQRIATEVPNSQEDAQRTDAIPDSGSHSEDALEGMSSQDAMKACWKHEIQRSHIVGKKKNKRIQVIDNHLKPEQQGQQREVDDPMDAYQAYASKTLSSRLSPPAFTGKGMGNIPLHGLRIENEFNLSKGKGKMLQAGEELDPLSCRKTDMLVEDSFAAYTGGKIIQNTPVVIPVPLYHSTQTFQGPQEGLHLPPNKYLAAQVYNNKCIHQLENRLPLSLSLQEGTSKIHQLKRKDSEANLFGGPSIFSKHLTNAVSGKGVHCEEITGARIKDKTVEGVGQLGIMKRYSEQTAEESEPGTLDDIPMEIVELLAKNQYERCLPDIENRNSMLEKSTVRMKAQMATGSTVYGEMGMSLSRDGQKEKSHGRPKKGDMVTRENVKPSKRKSVHYSPPFDGNSIGMNNSRPPRSPFEFGISQSQKKPPTGFQFPPMSSSQTGSARNCNFTASLEERGSSNATLQAHGGCSLHRTILQQDGEASRIWASYTPNHVSLGYDAPKKVVSQPAGSNMDMASLRSSPLHKQNMKRDVDLNCINLNAVGLEKLNRNPNPGTLSRMNGEYPYPCKHNGMDHRQNLRGSLDLYSNETIPAMHLLSLMDAGMQSHTPFNVGVSAEMLKRPSYPGDCNTKLEIGTSKAHGTQKRQSSTDYFRKSHLSDKPHGCFLGSPTFGASSSTHLDKKILRAPGFNGQNSTKPGKKEKVKSPNSTPQNRVSKQFSWSNMERATPLQHKLDVRGAQETSLPLKIISANSCVVNRNPADFTNAETGNAYMIRGEDLKFDKSIPKNKPRLPPPHAHKQPKNLKGTKTKEHSKH